MRSGFLLLAVVCAAIAQIQAPPAALTNASIEQMVRSGVPLPSILRAIKSAPVADFLVNSHEFTELLGAGATNQAGDQILAAMHQRMLHGPVIPPPAAPPEVAVITRPEPPPKPAVMEQPQDPPPPAPAQQADLPDDVGVYYWSDSDGWVQMMSEPVNWKTGGVLKTIGTAGVIKGDVNGHIRGHAGLTRITGQVQLLIYCPEGVEASEYQLIRLHDHPDSREFRTVTGGILHASGGADRDAIDFESSHVARRTWIIRLGSMTPGEYGVLPPGLSGSNSAASQLGKMYTFSVAE